MVGLAEIPISIPPVVIIIILPICAPFVVLFVSMLTRGFEMEELGLNLHITAFTLGLSTLQIDHPLDFAETWKGSVFIIVTLFLIVTAGLYVMARMSKKKIVISRTERGALISGIIFFAMSLFWNVSYFLPSG